MSTGHRRRILIVDDDDDVRGMMAEALTLEGFYVAGADSGEGVLDAIRAQRPDLLVLDLFMPGVDGVQVLEQLRQLDIRTPVVLVTGWPLTRRDMEGAVAVIPKPFELEHFLSMVRRVMQANEYPTTGQTRDLAIAELRARVWQHRPVWATGG